MPQFCRSLQIARENLLSADSGIRDANFGEVAGRVALLRSLLEAGVRVQALAQEQRSGLFSEPVGLTSRPSLSAPLADTYRFRLLAICWRAVYTGERRKKIWL